MGRYVIAIGGTGSKVMESIVYAACADAFYTCDDDGRRSAIPRLDMLSVDVDAACGNTTRAHRAAESYEHVRAAFSASPYMHPCFHTALAVDRWSMNLSRRAVSIRQMSENHAQDRLLSRALFTRAEAELAYSEGFRGHPDLGVLFFTDLLASLEDAEKAGQPDEFNSFMRRMESDLARGETVQLMLCGSIFGGTGASGIPAMSRYLSRRFAQSRERFVMGAMLMLPYYKVPAAQADQQRGIVVSSDHFLAKARTALQYYGMEHMLKSGPDDALGVFDAAYLLGLPPEHFVSTRLYSTGSQSQENDAHLLEWLAARCVARFFRTGFRGGAAHNIDCYYYQWHTPRLCWESFDTDGPMYRARYGALLKAAVVWTTECYPTLRQYLERPGSAARRVGYVAASFHDAGKLRPAKRAALKDQMDSLYRFFAFYTNWLSQVTGTLPIAMRGTDGANGLINAPLLDDLCTVLKQRGMGESAGREAQRLQRGLDKLILGPVPDRRGFDLVLRGLGGCKSGEPEAALASFLTALLQAVTDER